MDAVAESALGRSRAAVRQHVVAHELALYVDGLVEILLLASVGVEDHRHLHLLAVTDAVHVYRVVIRAVLRREFVLLLGRQRLAKVPRILRKVEKTLVAGMRIRPKQTLGIDNVANLRDALFVVVEEVLL